MAVYNILVLASSCSIYQRFNSKMTQPRFLDIVGIQLVEWQLTTWKVFR